MRTRILVVEARRLLPLLFLLVLLISLSVYNSFFRIEPVSDAPEPLEGSLVFTTADRGELNDSPSFSLAYSEKEWEQLRETAGVTLPDYPFSPAYEVAVLSMNGEIKSIRPIPQSDQVMQVQVQVAPRQNYYHVITVDRDQVSLPETYWVFTDEEGRVITQLAPFETVLEGEREKDEEEEEEEDHEDEVSTDSAVE